MNLLLAVAGLCLAALSSSSPQSAPRVQLEKVKDYEGHQVTVCGRVVTHDCDDKEHATTLDLDKPYWRKPPALLITKDARPSFPPGLEDRYGLATVCATGVVERYHGRHVVRVETPDDITMEHAPAAAVFGRDAVRPCDPGVQIPRLTRGVPPNYTREAMEAKQQGLVFVEAVVLPDGTVGAARVLYGLERFGLNDQGVRAVRRWRFKPGKAEGRPAAVVVTIELSFRLQ